MRAVEECLSVYRLELLLLDPIRPVEWTYDHIYAFPMRPYRAPCPQACCEPQSPLSVQLPLCQCRVSLVIYVEFKDARLLNRRKMLHPRQGIRFRALRVEASSELAAASVNHVDGAVALGRSDHCRRVRASCSVK